MFFIFHYLIYLNKCSNLFHIFMLYNMCKINLEGKTMKDKIKITYILRLVIIVLAILSLFENKFINRTDLFLIMSMTLIGIYIAEVFEKQKRNMK